MKRFKFLGAGAIVNRFLSDSAPHFPYATFTIYIRNLSKTIRVKKNMEFFPIDYFEPNEVPTFLCCSVDEEILLRKDPKTQDRGAVARENIALLRPFIDKGTFENGTYFVLTNPSEVISQFLSQNSGNSNIYALGLSVDYLRYQNILLSSESLASKFHLAGNHWDRPVPVVEDGKRLSRLDLDTLHEQYRKLVRSEFVGFRPPFQSGADAISHVVKAYVDDSTVLLSGKDSVSGNFVGGTFDTMDHTFNATKVQEPGAASICQEVYQRHQTFLSEACA